jgi:hypothetical protein
LKNLSFKLFVAILLLLSNCNRETVNEAVDDGLPPSTPTNLRVYAARDGEIGIEWNSSGEPDIKGYNIYRAELDTNFKAAGFTSDLFFVDDSLDYFTEYSYKINAVDDNDRISGFSEIVSAIPENIFHPLTPYGLEINAKNWDDSISINLNWLSWGETDILGYEIYRDTANNFDADSAKLVGFANLPTFVDKSNIKLLTEYYYCVIAVDKGYLKSSQSLTVSDYVLDKPELIFPGSNYNGSDFSELKFRTSSKKANYKIFILTNQVTGSKYEIEVNTVGINEIVSVSFDSQNLIIPYKEYFWRVAAFTENEDDPNTFTGLNSFTIIRN